MSSELPFIYAFENFFQQFKMKHLVSSSDTINGKYSRTGKVKPFWVCFSCWVILLLIALLSFTKYDSFVIINHHRSFAMDIVCTVFTCLGGGYILIPLALWYLYKKNYGVVIGLLMSALIISLLLALLKHLFHHPRPLACYGKEVVETAKWITLFSKNSFPSGHTATAFCIAAYLSLSFRNNRFIAYISFAGAVFTAYSRIYLGEHFLEDVLFGSIVGVSVAYVTVVAVRYFSEKIIHKKWAQKEGFIVR